MKKAIRIIALCLSVVFVCSAFFGKTVFNAFFLAETAVPFSEINGEGVNVPLKKGDYLIFGLYLGEPILWRVIGLDSGGKPILLTEYVICFKAFDAAGFGDDNDIRKYGSSDIKTSTLMQWLNSRENEVNYLRCEPDESGVYKKYNAYADESGFLCADNFEPESLELIDGGVSILSKNELSSLLPAELRRKTCTKSAILNSNAPHIIGTGKNVWYWVGSPVSSNRVSVAAVTSSGGFYKSLAFDGLTGVCPSVKLKAADAVSYGGCGSRDRPYIISLAGGAA